MLCQRCKGLLVHETFSDLSVETDRLSPPRRCVNCGYVEDSVVRANRLHPPAAKRPTRHGVVRKGGVIRTHSERYGSM